MFKLIKIIIGIVFFSIGIWCNPTLFSLALVMVGCYFLSRPLAFECGTGPGYFIIGSIFLLPAFFLTIPILKEMQIDNYTAEVVRKVICLISGVFSFLSIPKK